MATISLPQKNTAQAYTRAGQAHWQRVILLSVLGYEAAGCLAGGGMLVAAPDGRLMDMPVDIMHGTFPDFLVPGIILFALGILTTIAFIAVLQKRSTDWIMASLALGGLTIWFWVEIAILQRLHWLHAMWGLPIVAGGLATLPLFPRAVLQKGLLTSGIVASILYVIINIIVPSQWPAYNSITQTVSELSAVEAPTRILWIVLCTPYTLLMIAFALGVENASAGNRWLRTAGNLLFIYGMLSALWPFAPMHARETLQAGGSTFSDAMHITLGAVTEVIYLFVLGLTAAALGKRFRVYSVVTFVLLLLFGVLTFVEAPNVAANLSTPLIGVWERINIGIFLVWVIALAITLLRKKTSPSPL